MNQFVEQNDGIMRALVTNTAFDENVPGNQVGFLNMIEDGASIVQIVDFGVCVERQDARSYQRVAESAGFEGQSVEL